MPEEPKSSPQPPSPPQLDETLDAKPYEPPRPQMSRLADATYVTGLFGILGVSLGLLLCNVSMAFALLVVLGLACAPVAVVMGIVAMVKIGRSDGRLTGMGRAGAGVTVGVVLVLAPLSLLPVVMHVKENPQRAACKNNLRQIGVALHAYADDNAGEFPAEMTVLYPARVASPKSFLCPKSPGDWRKIPGTGRIEITKGGYLYVSGLKTSDPDTCVLAFDRPGNHDGAGQNVLCLDASVQWVKAPEPGKPDALKAMLDETREAVRKRGGEIRLVGE